MSEPLPKSPAMSKMLDTIFGGDRQADIRANRCRPAPLGCGKQIDHATEWKDEVSRREYAITGLCQKCQDSAFAEPEDKD